MLDGFDGLVLCCGLLLGTGPAAGGSGGILAPVPLVMEAGELAQQQAAGRRVWAGIKSVKAKIVQPARSGAVTLFRKVFRRR